MIWRQLSKVNPKTCTTGSGSATTIDVLRYLLLAGARVEMGNRYPLGDQLAPKEGVSDKGAASARCQEILAILYSYKHRPSAQPPTIRSSQAIPQASTFMINSDLTPIRYPQHPNCSSTALGGRNMKGKKSPDTPATSQAENVVTRTTLVGYSIWM